MTPKQEHYHKHNRRRKRRPMVSFDYDHNGYHNSNTTVNFNQPKSHTKPTTKSHSVPRKSIVDIDKFLLLPFALLLTFAARLQQVSYAQVSLPTPQHLSHLEPGHNLDNLHISEIESVGTIVHQLKVKDANNKNVTFALTGDTFSVNEDTGEVRLMKPLDRERQAQINTVLSVLDRNSEHILETRRKSIIIEDADDSWPTFQQHKFSLINNPSPVHVYQVELSEQAPNSSIVIGEILVTDADEGANAEMIFECRVRQSTNRACETFQIDSRRLQSGKYSLTVRTKTTLDYEQAQNYKLTLVARGKRPSPLKGAPLETEAIINVNIINVQDEAPVFVNAPYALSMNEGLKPGTRLLSMIVQDGDMAPQRDLSMIVVDSPFKKYFQVTKDPQLAKIWYLETGQTIDRESPLISQLNGNMFTIHLLAAELDDNGSPVASESELASALQQPANHEQTSVSLKGTLRRESITIVVLDLPDSRPVFVQASTGLPIENNLLLVNVSELLTSGAAIPNLDLAVQDLDQGINSRFNLTLQDSGMTSPASQAFSLESTIIHGHSNVVLNLINSSLIDYEDPSFREYRFSLIACKVMGPELDNPDQGPKDLITILEVHMHIQDANDNWPRFEKDQYIVSVPENSPPEFRVATIKAEDRDSGIYGRVDYMLRGLGASRFKLLSSEGTIMVNDCGVPHCLDYEVQPVYSLNYEARDGGGHTRNVSVIINVVDINDHAPKFTESVYKRELISDNLSSKQNYITPQLIVKARDGDGPNQGRNNITYHIKSTNLTGLDVEPNTGFVHLTKPLDLSSIITPNEANLPMGYSPVADNDQSSIRARDLLASDRKLVFEAEVVATDNGNPPLYSTATILLSAKGNRDGAPQFKQESYLAYVLENQPANKPFYQVQAVDPDDKDSQLRYSLGFDLNDLVQIDSSSGQLSFKSEIDYDDFKGVPYNITVYATDNARPYPLKATAFVSIMIQDVNNKKPKFLQKVYKTSLVQGKTRVGDGILQVQAFDLDKSNKLNYSLLEDTLTLSDRNGQQFTLDEIANASGGYLAQMLRVERLQMVQNLKRMFAINSRTGVVELKQEPDYSFAASISFQVKVVDLNQEVFTSAGVVQHDFAQCDLFLQTFIDKTPIFAPPWSIAKRDYNLTILEELPIETQIFSLIAKDPQTNKKIDMFEKVFESDPKDYFRIDRSGLVLINRRIDYEELGSTKYLTVSVKALTDDAMFSVANLNVKIIDLNDNAPVFKNQTYRVSMSEAQQSGNDILTVSADDRDSEQFSQVYYYLSGYQSELFQIHPRKGSISLRKNSKLDRDMEPNYHLTAIASDCNQTESIGSSSQQLVASTPSVLMSVGGGEFSSALGSNCKKSTASIEITLIDENDNDPVFINTNKRGEYEAVVSETVSVDTVITQVQARDIDEGANGQVVYEIVKTGDDLGQMFKIDSEGYISAQASLSGLGRPNPYKITIRAHDLGAKTSRQTYATLLLTIQDVVSNDGVPRFIRPKLDEVILLSENVGPSTFVYQVQAVDPDENEKLMYKFIQPSDTFDIDPFDGVIKTQHRANFYLDREQVANYTLIIVAQDFGNPPKQAQQVLTIKITDINDNEPYFDREVDSPPLVLYVNEEVPKDTLIGTIQAIDKDEGTNSMIGYEILDGNVNNLFRLSWDGLSPQDSSSSSSSNKKDDDNMQTLSSGNNACRIYSTGRLDREARDSYTLTIRASGISRVRSQLLPAHLRDPLSRRNPFNQYNASDFSKTRVTIKLIDINDNRPVFSDPFPKSIVDSSAEVYSQLMVVKAKDGDSNSLPILYSISSTVYYSNRNSIGYNQIFDSNILRSRGTNELVNQGPDATVMKNVFDIDPRSGILRNTISLRPYTDGYFEIYIKADSGQYELEKNATAAGVHSRQPFFEQSSSSSSSSIDDLMSANGSKNNKCSSSSNENNGNNLTTTALGGAYVGEENCFVAIMKAVVFVTHQKETFRFVFNKTRLNDRLDEFKDIIQKSLEDLMFEPVQAQASYAGGSVNSNSLVDSIGSNSGLVPRAERVFLNTFQTDFYEREDGSLDFSTITSCSQLVKFDDRIVAGQGDNVLRSTGSVYDSTSQFSSSSFVPNQVVNFEEVLSLLKALNQTTVTARLQTAPTTTATTSTTTINKQTTNQQHQSLFNQYGLVRIERCQPDKTLYKMKLSEQLALYFAALIALIGIFLAFIVSKMRKSYERNLKILQRSKYHYGMAAAAAAAATTTSPFGA